MDRVTISEHDSEAGSWSVARLEPGRSLEPYIGAFYAYDERGTSFRRRRELPDGSAVLIFHLGGKLRVEHPKDARCEIGEGQGFYSGASATYAVTETDGAQAGAQIKFNLLGARLFLGLPLKEFGDALIDASQAFGQPATELRDRLTETRSLSKRVGMLARAATRQLDSQHGISPGLAFAFRRLHRADARIADVAREIGMSRERFSKAFRREFGLSPKTFARVRRFARAPCPRTRAVLDRRSSRGSVRIRRPGPHDSRLRGIFRQRAVGAVAAGVARRWRLHRLSETVTFLQDERRWARLLIEPVSTSDGEYTMSIAPKPTQIIPYLFYRDVDAGLDFLCRAFGFKEEMRHGTPSGGVHGEASFQGQLVMMGQGAHERSMRSPRDAGAATMGLFIYLDDVDKHYEVAKAAGAEIVHPPKDVDYGRTYWANDPEGHPWFFTSPPKG